MLGCNGGIRGGPRPRILTLLQPISTKFSKPKAREGSDVGKHEKVLPDASKLGIFPFSLSTTDKNILLYVLLDNMNEERNVIARIFIYPLVDTRVYGSQSLWLSIFFACLLQVQYSLLPVQLENNLCASYVARYYVRVVSNKTITSWLK